MLSLDWWKQRAIRALWSLICWGVLCLILLSADAGSLCLLEQYNDRLPMGHFVFRVIFLCLGVLTASGFFAPSSGEGKKKAAFRLKSVLTNVDCWIWTVLMGATVLLLPQGLGFLPFVQHQLYADELWLRVLLVLAAMITAILVMAFDGGMAPMDRNTHPLVYGLALVAKGLGLALVFALAAAVLPAIVIWGAVLSTVPSLVSLPLIFGLIALVLLLGFGGALLAVRKKKRFIKRLRRLCEEQGFVLLEERCSFSSLFFSKRYSGAVLEREGRRIALRLCGLRHALTPAVFEGECKGKRLHSLQFGGVKLLQWKRAFSFAVEGEGEKAVVLCPCPKRIFITKQNGTLVEADNGDRPLDNSCTLYTSEGFLNYLDRLPALERKG